MTNLIMERTTKNKFKGVDVDVQSWGHLPNDGPRARWSAHQGPGGAKSLQHSHNTGESALW